MSSPAALSLALALLALIILLLASPQATAQAIQDSRCYLMNGGAVENFFISEDTPVGAIIGVLSVNGDASEEDGNISLRLQEKDAAIGVVPGSKNLTLLRRLDREEALGPSNVYVNVRCDRRRSTDPSFVIPVWVRVWDVNDNAPTWIGAPYRIRLSELTAVGSRVLQARATDADQAGPHATPHYSVVEAKYSDYFEFPNELEGTLVLNKGLDYETINNFTVTLRAQDQGQPPKHNDTTLYVEVMDADDQNPKFTQDHYTAVLPEDAREGAILPIWPGPIRARDQDIGIDAPIQYWATGAEASLVRVDRDSGIVSATTALLSAELPATVVIKAVQVDNSDRYALATLSISRRAQNSALNAAVRFSQRAYHIAASEDTAPGTVLASLKTDPPRNTHSPPLQFYVSDRSFLDKFAINSVGEVLLRKALDYETADRYQYQVMVTDGATNDTASLNITVININEWEPRFRYPQYEFRLGDDTKTGDHESELLPVGKLEAFDGDKGDRLEITLRGSDARMLEVDGNGSVYVKRAALAALNSSLLHVVATARDSGNPPRQTSVPVIVHVSEKLTGAGGGRSPAMLAVFAAALALLAGLVLALLAYIYRSRRRSKTSAPSNNNKDGGFVSHDKPLSAAAVSVIPPTLAPVLPAAAGSSGSLLSVSAGASTILANSTSSLDLRGDTLPNNGFTTRQSTRFPAKTKIAPAPPVLTTTGGGETTLMSDHIHNREGMRSGVAWPSATIPARVKQLSWDEPNNHNESKGSAEEDIHDATNPAVQEHMNLTVYF